MQRILLSVICIILALTVIFPFAGAVMLHRTQKTTPPAPIQSEAEDENEENNNEGEDKEDSAPEPAPDEDGDEDEIYVETEDEETYMFPYIDPAYTQTNAPETTEAATEEPVTETQIPETEEITDGYDEAKPQTGADSMSVRVYLHSEGKYETMKLSDYIIGVILAEMPTYFELEAFKAQAVASRTYTVYKMLKDTNYHSSYHGSTGADICTNSGHCQAYTTYQRIRSKWGKKTADEAYSLAKRAVEETSGLVMTYKGEVIFSPYHACSYKFTETGKNAWGLKDTPYLKTVSSPERELDIVYSTVKISAAKFKKSILSQSSKAELSSSPDSWIGSVKYNEGGRVETIKIGGVSFGGRDIQSCFSLRGSNFTIKYDKASDTFIFDVRGWGHGVGMSQYGANVMALDGASYAEILTHYYSGVKIEVCDSL